MQNRAKVLQKMHICKRIEQKVYFWVKVACIWAALSERTFEVGLPQAMSVPSKVHLFVQCEGEAHICPSLRERTFEVGLPQAMSVPSKYYKKCTYASE